MFGASDWTVIHIIWLESNIEGLVSHSQPFSLQEGWGWLHKAIEGPPAFSAPPHPICILNLIISINWYYNYNNMCGLHQSLWEDQLNLLFWCKFNCCTGIYPTNWVLYVQVNAMTLTYCAYEYNNHSTKSFYKGLKLLTNPPLATSLYNVKVKVETNHIIGRVTKVYLEGYQSSFYNTYSYPNSTGFSQSFQLSLSLP